MKYYFASYVWRRRGSKDHHFSNIILDKHPLEFLKNTLEHEEEYTLLSYHEISLEEYEKFKDWIN